MCVMNGNNTVSTCRPDRAWALASCLGAALLLSGCIEDDNGSAAGPGEGSPETDTNQPVAMAYNTDYGVDTGNRIQASSSEPLSVAPLILIRHEQDGTQRYARLVCEENDQALQFQACGSANLY